MLRSLRRRGLDIVLTFDSTGSMGGEIDQVKRQIDHMSKTLMRLVPKTRISICTYRDKGDVYVVKGEILSDDVARMERTLTAISAGGGGDGPEAVQEGLRWATESNEFRRRAKKVVIIFGDAPPHAEDTPTCLALARAFRQKHRGIVSTVTCARGAWGGRRDPRGRGRAPDRRIPEFVQIAKAGGGEAFLSTDHRKIMEQLMVLVFGSKYRDKVKESFALPSAP